MMVVWGMGGEEKAEEVGEEEEPEPDVVEDEEAVEKVPVGEPDGDGGYGEDDEDYSEEGDEGGGEFVMFGGGVIGG